MMELAPIINGGLNPGSNLALTVRSTSQFRVWQSGKDYTQNCSQIWNGEIHLRFWNGISEVKLIGLLKSATPSLPSKLEFKSKDLKDALILKGLSFTEGLNPVLLLIYSDVKKHFF